MSGARGTLVLVGTPLGNRDDLSPRARAAILGADLLLCEDTRSPLRLLGDGVVLPPRISCFVANEGERAPLLLDRLGRGERVVYVSEAGMPIWSDPGDKLVRAALAAGFEVDVIPGPTAASVALCLSGLDAREVRFVGFPPRGGRERAELLDSLSQETATVIFYEAGNRTAELVRDLAKALPDAAQRPLAVARELTKLHQEVLRGSVAELAASIEGALRGEVTVVLGGAPATAAEAADPAQTAARALWEALQDPGLRPRAKAKRIAELTGLDAREIYAALSRDGGS
ncbi:MAG: rRNA small subunit methyltransferase 1 [Myxococcales bacterium]|nr:rRNA small subunit methyltransferase 1 [Myxococcales bacterium]